MSHPEIGSRVKLIKLEAGFKEHKMYIGKIGEVTRCEKHGTRRMYWVRFMKPHPDLLFLYRPEIELVDEEENGG